MTWPALFKRTECWTLTPFARAIVALVKTVVYLYVKLFFRFGAEHALDAK